MYESNYLTENRIAENIRSMVNSAGPEGVRSLLSGKERERLFEAWNAEREVAEKAAQEASKKGDHGGKHGQKPFLKWEDVEEDRIIFRLVEKAVLADEETKGFSFTMTRDVIQSIFNRLRRQLGILQILAEDDAVTEIMVNGPEHVYVERNGKMEKTPLRFENQQELEEMIRRLAGKVHREINELNPIVDARLEDGSRVNGVYGNVALNGPILTVRRFPEKGITMDALLAYGTVTSEAAEFLGNSVKSGMNIFISGGTSSGKTTFLNALTEYIPPEERVVIIEDSAELQPLGLDNLVRLETKNANAQGKGEVTMRKLIRTSLRMRPDRIIVGEVRGEEVREMIQAMNSGHDGSLSTGHGNSAEGMLYRLEAMFLMASDFPLDSVRRQVAEALDLIVHLGRMPDKSRKVLEITEVCGYEEGMIRRNQLFVYETGKGLVRTGAVLKNRGKAELRGIMLQ